MGPRAALPGIVPPRPSHAVLQRCSRQVLWRRCTATVFVLPSTAQLLAAGVAPARHRACGPLAVRPQSLRSDAAHLALHCAAARRCGLSPAAKTLALSAKRQPKFGWQRLVLSSQHTLGVRTAPAAARRASLSATRAAHARCQHVNNTHSN